MAMIHLGKVEKEGTLSFTLSHIGSIADPLKMVNTSQASISKPSTPEKINTIYSKQQLKYNQEPKKMYLFMLARRRDR